MTHQEKIDWMLLWAHKNNVLLALEGECGFGRECVGITNGNAYPDYQWYDDDYERIDDNGKVWCPPDAYHKHECVAVLGRGEKAEAQLYDWLKWFDDNGFKPVTERKPLDELRGVDPIVLLFKGTTNHRMVKGA